MDWLRLYHDVLDDPKVQGLSPEDFRSWINCLIVASRHNPRGQLPPLQQLAFFLRASPEHTEALCGRLLDRSLFERRDGVLVVHGWSGRQYESDDSTSRVRNFRQRQRNVSRNVPETAPEQNRADNRTEQNQSRAEAEKAKGRSALVLPHWLPKENWEAFLDMRKRIRKAATDRAQQIAIRKLDELRASGFSPADVLDQSTLNSWTGLYPLKGNINGTNRAAQRTANNLAALEEANRSREERDRRAAGNVS